MLFDVVSRQALNPMLLSPTRVAMLTNLLQLIDQIAANSDYIRIRLMQSEIGQRVVDSLKNIIQN